MPRKTGPKKTGPKKKATAKKQTPAKKLDVRALAAGTARLEREWKRREERLVELRARGTEAFDELYEEVHEILTATPPLYLGGGMRSEREFIARMLPGESERTVRRNVLVAISFTPEDEQRKGIAFLEQLAKYEQERTGSRELPRALDLARVRIEVDESGRKVRKRALDCTMDDLERARAALGKKKTKPARPEETALARALPRKKAFAGTKIRVSDGRATFTNVPLSELVAFGRAVAGVRLPEE